MSKIPKAFVFVFRIDFVWENCIILFFEKMSYNYSFSMSDSTVCIRLNIESLNNPGPFYSMIIPNTMRSDSAEVG